MNILLWFGILWMLIEPHANLSFYGGPTQEGFYGQRTASGIVYSETHWGVAAPRHVRMGTYVRIWANGKSVIVPVTDRLGVSDPEMWDLSYAAAQTLGLTLEQGRATAVIEELLVFDIR